MADRFGLLIQRGNPIAGSTPARPIMPYENKQKQKEYLRKYILNRYHERMNSAKNKLGGKCIQCGSIEKLQFDHIYPNNKSFAIGKMWSISFNLFEQELKKCQLLCEDCHKIKHHSRVTQ